MKSKWQQSRITFLRRKKYDECSCSNLRRFCVKASRHCNMSGANTFDYCDKSDKCVTCNSALRRMRESIYIPSNAYEVSVGKGCHTQQRRRLLRAQLAAAHRCHQKRVSSARWQAE